MIMCSKEEFRKICNLAKPARICKGNYWLITRQGEEHTVHVSKVIGPVVVAKITKTKRLVGLIAGYTEVATEGAYQRL